MEANETFSLVIKTEDVIKLGAAALIGGVLSIEVHDGIKKLYKKIKSKKESKKKSFDVSLEENEES